LGCSTTCILETVRKGKTIVLTVEKAIAVIEANKKKRKKPDWQKY
jgi:hypothetical protein